MEEVVEEVEEEEEGVRRAQTRLVQHGKRTRVRSIDTTLYGLAGDLLKACTWSRRTLSHCLPRLTQELLALDSWTHSWCHLKDR